MAHRFICYKSLDNIRLTIETGIVGAKSKSFLDKLHVDDVLYLYFKGSLWAKLKVNGEGFFDNNRIWKNEIYPFRFKTEIVKVCSQPLTIVELGLLDKLRTLYGIHWGFRVLFTPNELDKSIFFAIESKFVEVKNLDSKFYAPFFKENALFGLTGKKRAIEIEKIKFSDNS